MTAADPQSPTTSKSIVELSTTIQDQDPKYESVKLAGTLLMWSSAGLALITVLYAFINRCSSSANPAANSSPNLPAKISLREMLMTAVLAGLFAALGVFLRTAYNGMRTKLLLEALKLQGELNSQLHAERLAKIKAGSNPP